MKLIGRYHIQIIRDGKAIHEFDTLNGIVDVGATHMLETQFNGGTPITAWYAGFINNASFSALAAADTMASHAGWLESVAYSNATRPEWTAGTAAARVITNAVTVDFNINASAVLKGIFICGGTGAATKSASTGTLWGTAAFSSPYTVADGDVIKCTYTVTVA